MKALIKEKIGILILVILTFIVCIRIGSVAISTRDILNVIKYNIFEIGDINKNLNGIIWYIRMPRVITAFIVGGGLAISGATMQSLFQNPMADPGILGISTGASLGAIIAIALGFSTISIWTTPLIAIAFSFFAGIIVYKIGMYKGKSSNLTLILSGIAITTFLGAVNTLILTNISNEQIKEFIFWSTGNLSGKHWEQVRMIGIPIILLSFFITKYYKELNIMLLGEEESLALGIDVNRFRKKILGITSGIVALSVCISGNIGFVGLVVPHILRKKVGNDNKKLLPLSFFAGGIFLTLTDLVARMVLSPKEISVGIVTSLIGAPYFVYLLIRYKSGEN